MMKERKFRIVKVSRVNGIGMEPVEQVDQTITYDGGKVTVKL